MQKQGVQVDAICRLKRVCGGVRVRGWKEDGGFWGERSEDGLEEVASGELGGVGDGVRGGWRDCGVLVGGAGL